MDNFKSLVNKYCAAPNPGWEECDQVMQRMGKELCELAIEKGVSPIEIEWLMTNSFSYGFTITKARYGCTTRMKESKCTTT